MVANIVIITILIIIYFAFANYNRQFNATTSAIREVWSGTCRLSCRPNEYTTVTSGGQVEYPEVEGGLSGAGGADCICDSCPCEIVDSILRTCRPVTYMYSRIIESLSGYYYNAVETITYLHNYLKQVMQTGLSGSRRREPVTLSRLNSRTNIDFVRNKVLGEIEKAKDTVKLKASRSITFLTPETEKDGTSATASPQDVTLNQEMGTKLSTKSSAESGILSICSKCKEKGKTCTSSCPHAKKK